MLSEVCDKSAGVVARGYCYQFGFKDDGDNRKVIYLDGFAGCNLCDYEVSGTKQKIQLLTPFYVAYNDMDRYSHQTSEKINAKCPPS